MFRRTRILAMLAAVLLAVSIPVPALASAEAIPWDGICDILNDVYDSENFYWDLDQEPLACKSDENGDGIWELLLVYPCRNDDGLVYVMENVWLVTEEESKCVGMGVLFNEVGGNSGTLTLAKRDGELYVLVQTQEPDGDSFHDFYDIFSLAEGEIELGEDYFMMTRTGVYGQEDDADYVVGKEAVTREEFEDILNSFEICYTLDILADPDGDVMPFNVMLS